MPTFKALDLNVCNALYGRSGVDVAAVLLLLARRRGGAWGSLPRLGPARRSRAWPSTREGPIPVTYDGALFFADCRTRLHLRGADGRGRPARSSDGRTVPDAKAGSIPGLTSRPGLKATSTTRASHKRRRARRGNSPDLIRPGNAPQARLKAEGPTWGNGAVDGRIQRRRIDRSPRPGKRSNTNGISTETANSLPRRPMDTRAETYESASENKTAAVRVVDELDNESVAQTTVYPGDTPPVPTIASALGSARMERRPADQIRRLWLRPR